MIIKNIGVNDGHTLNGAGSGAIGKIVEGEHTRLVGAEVRRLIAERGHGAINCTVDHANTTTESLQLVVGQANRHELDWFIAIHFNAGGGKGVEVYTYEGRQYKDAIDVCKNIESLGFINRGVKAGTGLYVIRKTKAKAMLIEVCFVDTDDVDKYMEVGYKAIAKAIVDAIIEHANTSEPTPPIEAAPNGVFISNDVYNPLILDLQRELNKQGFKDKNGNRLVENGYNGPLTASAAAKCYITTNSKGNITKILQQILYKIGLDPKGIDGHCGPGMTLTIKNYNKIYLGLNNDPNFGPGCWRYILGQ